MKNHLPRKTNSFGIALVVLLSFTFPTDLLFAQEVVVTGTENNIKITKINLSIGSEQFEQVSPAGNLNPIPIDSPVLIESVVLEDGKEIFATLRKPKVTNPNTVLGTDKISRNSVEIINSTKSKVGHGEANFFANLEDVVSTPDLRSYWSIGSQPSIPDGERFVDLEYLFPSSGYILFSERNGNSAIDFIPLGIDGKPIPGATTIKIRGYQWDTGVNHETDNPSQKQWLVVFSASLFNTLQPVSGVRIVSIDEPDGKLIFFVGNVSAAPDLAGPINNLTETKAVLNVLDNDELNEEAVRPFDVDLSVITPFPENSLVFNEDGTVDVPAGTPAGTYSMTYQIRDIVGGESDQATVTVKVSDLMPEANDDNGGNVSISGADAVVNVLDNDFVRGEVASLANVLLSEVSNLTKGILTLNTDGTVDVAAGAKAGLYQLTYQICDQSAPSKCDTAVVSVYVDISLIDAVEDDFGSYNQNGVLGNVLTNDRLNGVPVSPNQVTAVITKDGGLAGLVLEENGVLRLQEDVAPGSYVLEYELSEITNPGNSDRAEVRFSVKSSKITTVNDRAVTNQNQSIIIAVLENDKSASGAFDLSSLKVATASKNGTAAVQKDGTIEYLPSTNFAGEDEFTYRICDSQDGSACSTSLVTVTVRPIQIDLSKNVNTTNLAVGETVTYTITIKNNSDFVVKDIILQDVLPDLLLLASGSPSPSENRWAFSELAPGEQTLVSIEAVAVAPGEATNKVELKIGSYETSATAPSVTIGEPPVDLKIQKTSHEAEIFQGNEFEYEIVVENVGTHLASEVTVKDDLPNGLSYVGSSFTASSNEIEALPSVKGSQISWSIASFPAGETLTIVLKVKADRLGSKINTVEVDAALQKDLNPEDNTAQDVNEVLDFVVPNVITPGDRDNKNDVLIIKGLERFASNRIVIFNRWGDHVFEADNYQNNWDAEGLSPGSYFYVLELIDSDSKKQVVKGWVQVIKN